MLGPIHAIDQAFADPQVIHLGVAAPGGPDDTDDILAGVGYIPTELANMPAAGMI